MIYLLIGYMWLFVHRPFEVWPWLGAWDFVPNDLQIAGDSANILNGNPQHV